MKKNYFYLITFLLLTVSVKLNATKLIISVGAGSMDFFYNYFPTGGQLHVGDTVIFNYVSGVHNVVGTTTPSGSTTLQSMDPLPSTTPSYTYYPNISGTYNFICNHDGSVGNFVVLSGAGVNEISADLLTAISPNPCIDKLLIKYKSITTIDLFNIIGENLKSFQLSPLTTSSEIDVTNLPAGIYFCRMLKEGIIVETKKIIKSR